MEKELRAAVQAAAAKYFDEVCGTKKELSYIPASGKLLDKADLSNMIDATLDMWLTAGRFNDQFEKDFADFLGVKFALSTNSGSSANLLALSALTSYKLGDRRLKKGDEVISVAAGFPTTVNPIIQQGLIPVFVDCEIGTYNIDVKQIEAAVSPKTKAIFLAHTLGNMFDMDAIMDICKKHNLWLIEDSCDALGAEWDGKKAGTIGHIGTYSFYPAHHMTMGEGGAVVTNDPQLYRIILSFRDWGRDCWCKPGVDNTCKNRFNMQLGHLPFGYDHKYTYSHIGFNYAQSCPPFCRAGRCGGKPTEKIAGLPAKTHRKCRLFTKQTGGPDRCAYFTQGGQQGKTLLVRLFNFRQARSQIHQATISGILGKKRGGNPPIICGQPFAPTANGRK